MTLLNSFRLVLNLCFGTNLGPLDDSICVYASYSHPYKLLDVTDKVRS